jgi:tetrahydromethanopterin S-methyltransferase subunit G
MNWQEILIILVPLLGMMSWIYNKLEKRFEKIEEKFGKIDQRFDHIEEKLRNIDLRLARLEGRFDERGYWESRYYKNGTHDTEEK